MTLMPVCMEPVNFQLEFEMLDRQFSGFQRYLNSSSSNQGGRSPLQSRKILMLNGCLMPPVLGQMEQLIRDYNNALLHGPITWDDSRLGIIQPLIQTIPVWKASMFGMCRPKYRRMKTLFEQAELTFNGLYNDVYQVDQRVDILTGCGRSFSGLLDVYKEQNPCLPLPVRRRRRGG